MSSPQALRGISSMATKAILAQLAAAFAAQTGQPVGIESVGGVDAAKRVNAGEAFDIVLLATDAVDRLITSGHLSPHSRVDWAQSPVAVAVASNSHTPDIRNEAALKETVLTASSISYSTGPSGVYLAQLFERWGIAEAVKAKLVVPQPGISVGSLLASAQVALGFQQRSELINLPGLKLLGDLPADVAYTTIFSAATPLSLDAPRQQAAQNFLAFLNTPDANTIKQLHGMSPV